jgi:Zn-dependent protease
MESPFSFRQGQPVNVIGRVFDTPVAIQGVNWLPVNQTFFWIFFTWRSVKNHRGWPGWQHLLVGGMKMTVMLGSEWCHNLAHTAAARAAGQPVDALRVIAGMPVLIYNEPEHPSITPRQHLVRSLAGPAISGFLLLISKVFQRVTSPGSFGREIADVAFGMNTFVTLCGLVPVPEFDGGPILKWSLRASGLSLAKTEFVTTEVNRAIGAGLAGAAVVAVSKRNWLLALIFTFLGGLALVEGFKGKFTKSHANRLINN